MIPHNLTALTAYALVLHITVWTLVPFFTNANVPLDIILNNPPSDTLAWGYAHHPPLLAWLFTLWRALTPHSDLFVYLLSQLCVVTSMVAIWQLAKQITTPLNACLAVLFVQGSLYHTYLSPEFNHNVILLPLWSLAILAFYHALHSNSWRAWAAWSVAILATMLAKYTSALLILAMLAVLSFPPYRHHLRNPRLYAAASIAFLLFLPHIFWLVDNHFSTVHYALARGSTPTLVWYEAVLSPLRFVLAQFLHVTPMLLFWLALGCPRPQALTHALTKEQRYFLLPLIIMPFVLATFASWLLSLQLRTQWGTPFLLLLPVLIVLAIRLPDRIPSRSFLAVWLALLVTTAAAYPLAAYAKPYLTHTIKRSQFPGKQLSDHIHQLWHEQSATPLPIIIGDRWVAGLVRYYTRKNPPHLFVPPLSPHQRSLATEGAIILTLAPQDPSQPRDDCPRPHTFALTPDTVVPVSPLIFHGIIVPPHTSCLPSLVSTR
ncbi:MAG: glycosyltransferase family 39 protein [Alphaproteobacteria bacterium GM202ARS2]|nr:glycosyltransferase family 39 protein [Alphaproteobacteria bacterium GM202ARS2]